MRRAQENGYIRMQQMRQRGNKRSKRGSGRKKLLRPTFGEKRKITRSCFVVTQRQNFFSGGSVFEFKRVLRRMSHSVASLSTRGNGLYLRTIDSILEYFYNTCVRVEWEAISSKYRRKIASSPEPALILNEMKGNVAPRNDGRKISPFIIMRLWSICRE